MSISQRFRAWIDKDPIRDGWSESKALRSAFNAGWHQGHNQAAEEAIQDKSIKAAFNRGLNAQLKQKRLTHRSASKVLSDLYRYLTYLDKKGNSHLRRVNIAEAINRVKLNYHLLQFLQEKGLVEEFKRWYYASEYCQDSPETEKMVADEKPGI